MEKSKKQKIINNFFNEHEEFKDRPEMGNELSRYLINHNMEDITDNEYLSIESELAGIYFSIGNEHY